MNRIIRPQATSPAWYNQGRREMPRGPRQEGTIYVNKCIHIYIYIYIYVSFFVPLSIYLSIYLSLSLYIYIYIYVYTHACITYLKLT